MRVSALFIKFIFLIYIILNGKHKDGSSVYQDCGVIIDDVNYSTPSIILEWNIYHLDIPEFALTEDIVIGNATVPQHHVIYLLELKDFTQSLSPRFQISNIRSAISNRWRCLHHSVCLLKNPTHRRIRWRKKSHRLYKMWRHHRRKFKVGRPAVKIKFKDLLLHISFLFLSSLCLATALPIKDDKRCNDIGQKKKEPKELFIVDKCPKIINDVICYMMRQDDEKERQPHQAATSARDTADDQIPRKKIRSNAVGNQYVATTSTVNMYPEISKVDLKDAGKRQHWEDALPSAIDALESCCSIGGTSGCIMKQFNNGKSLHDYDAAYAYCITCASRGGASAKDTFLQDIFNSSVIGISSGIRQKQLIHNFLIPPLNGIGRPSIPVCRAAFQVVYGISDQEMRDLAVWKKTNGSIESFNSTPFTASTIPGITFARGEQIYRENLSAAVADNDCIRNGLTPLVDTQHSCVIWLSDYFERFGDSLPDDDIVNICVDTKKQVFERYVREKTKNKMPTVDISKFYNLWAVLFPKHRRRPHCDIPGSCDTCFQIEQLRQCSHDKQVEKALHDIHFLHRGGMFMPERTEYIKRRDEVCSAENIANPSILSFIIDIMDQKKCQIPSKGTQATFTHPLKLIITGVKVHYDHVSLFPSINTCHKGANLTIHIIDTVISQWVAKYKKYPTKVDGGSENANQYVLHHLEHLVSKRVAREIWYTRLPTGHTHDDIDGCFGVIRKYFTATKVIKTFDEFKEGVEKAFLSSDKSQGLSCRVEDIIAVTADYKSFYTPFLDPHLEHLYSLIETQHQWRFSAVEASRFFPRAVMTQFRAFSSPKVIEFTKQNKGQCLTPVGTLTGLEPKTVYCEWRPASNDLQDDPARNGIRGTYLLQGDPSGTLLFAEISEEASDQMAATQAEVRSVYGLESTDDEHITAYWNNFFSTYRPAPNVTTAQFVTQLTECGKKPTLPLQQLIEYADVKIVDPPWLHLIPLTYKSAQEYIDWPDILVAATNSVVTSLNRNNNIGPRIAVPTDAYILQERTIYSITTDTHYEELKTWPVANLHRILRRKCGYNGELLCALGSSRAVIVNKLQAHDLKLATVFNKPAPMTSLHFFELQCGSTSELASFELSKVIAHIEWGELFVCDVTREDLRCFRKNLGFSKSAINSIMFLFGKWENRVHVACENVQHQQHGYIEMSRYMFMSSQLYTDLLLGQFVDQWLLKIDQFEHLFFPIQLYPEEHPYAWSLVIVSRETKRIGIFNPLESVYMLEPLVEEIKFNIIASTITPFLNSKFGYTENQRWEIGCHIFPLLQKRFVLQSLQKEEVQQNINCDAASGVIVAAALYFLSQSAPVFFNLSSIESFRTQLGCWLLDEQLPI